MIIFLMATEAELTTFGVIQGLAMINIVSASASVLACMDPRLSCDPSVSVP